MRRILDPRTKIILIVLAAVYITLRMDLPMETFVVFIYLVPFALAGLHKYWIGFAVLYTLQVISSLYLLPYIDQAFFIYIASFLTNGLRLLLPGMIAGIYALKTTTVSEWIAAFKVWRIPNWLMIPVAVMARFFPAIREDYQHIRKAMAFRGIGTNVWDLIKHPVQTLEYILIPLLMNATHVAEDLTISALTKGLSLPGQHTTIVQLKMTAYDWIYLVIAFIPLVQYVGGVFS